MAHRTEYLNDSEIISDGRTVWVNIHTDGTCIGRFSPVGVDIHVDGEAQMRGAHCLDCFPRSRDSEVDWKRFKNGMLKHYGIVVSDAHRPSSGPSPFANLERHDAHVVEV